jgi:hypothetical protein
LLLSEIDKLSLLIKEVIDQSKQVLNNSITHDQLKVRNELLSTIYNLLFNDSQYGYVVNRAGEWKESNGDAFLEIRKNTEEQWIYSCKYETSSALYQMVIPLHLNQMDLYLSGILALGSLNFIMMNIQKQFQILNKVTNEIKTGYWHSPYNDKELTRQDVVIINLLEDSAIDCFSKLNRKWLLEDSIFKNEEIDLLRIWSLLYSEYTSQNVYNTYNQTPFVELYPEWMEFNSFSSWALRNEYFEGASIIRCNQSGGFVPSNCVWIGKTKLLSPRYYHSENNQVLTPSDLRKSLVTVMGVSRPVYEWERISGIPSIVILGRVSMDVKPQDLFHSTGIEDLFNKYKNTLISIDEEEKSLLEWSQSSGISFKTIVSRLMDGKAGKSLIYRPEYEV